MEKNTEEKQNTPDLSQLLADGRPVFGGATPAADAEPGKPALPGPDAAEKAAAEAEKAAATEAEKTAEAEKPAAAEKTAATEKEKADAAEAAAAAGKGAGKEGGDKAVPIKKEDKPLEPAPRFKSHEEAEKGYREVQSKATRAEQRAADLEKENLALKEARDQARTDAERLAAQAVARTNVLSFGKERKKQALEAIDALDPDAPDYQDKASELLVQADIDIYDNIQQNRPAAPAGEKTPAPKASAGETPDEEAIAREHLLGRIKESGIADDDELFWLFAGQAPSVDEEGKRIEFDRQIEWALERTKNYNSKQETRIKESIEKTAGARGRKKQEEEIPLGRGGNPAGPGAPEDGKEKPAEEKKPFGLNDAMDFALSARRLD
jgi:hypothetical protein